MSSSEHILNALAKAFAPSDWRFILSLASDDEINRVADIAISDAEEEGYEDGKKEGFSDGYSQAYDEVAAQFSNIAVAIKQGDEREAMRLLSEIAGDPSMNARAEMAAQNWGTPANLLSRIEPAEKST